MTEMQLVDVLGEQLTCLRLICALEWLVWLIGLRRVTHSETQAIIAA